MIEQAAIEQNQKSHLMSTVYFTHGVMEIRGTIVFILATLALEESRDGWISTDYNSQLKDALADAELKRRANAINEISVGDVVCEMHGHEANDGVLKGWEVHDRHVTTDEMAKAIISTLPVDNEANNHVIGNKMARVIGIVDDLLDTLQAVRVLYLYDHTYHCATLRRPQ